MIHVLLLIEGTHTFAQEIFVDGGHSIGAHCDFFRKKAAEYSELSGIFIPREKTTEVIDGADLVLIPERALMSERNCE